MSDPVVLLSTGDVVGPAGGVTDNSMVLFSGTSGKLIKGNNAQVTAAGLALLDDADNAAQRTTLGLGNVNNTSDANKQISVATQSALDLKAPLASPIFTGNPSAPTPAQFDNDTSLATTAFVKRALGNASSAVQISANTTLSAASAGAVIQVTVPGITLTLPPVAGYTGNATMFSGFSSTGDFTLASGSANIFTGGGGALVSSVTIKGGSHFIVVSTDNANWFLLGTAALPTIGSYFGASLAANGYQRIPGGLIIQWGTYAARVTSVTFPTVFPTACRSVAGANNFNGISNMPGIYGYTPSGFSSSSSAAATAYVAIGY